jgi:2-keto-3-deoxy-L-fuconate dehydrogenase
MTKRLEGKTAVITAAGQGIGRAIAEAFVREGARVHASDIDISKLEELECARRQKLDVRDEVHVNDYIKDVGAIDILVNCAGYVHQGTILECDMAVFDVNFDVNVRGMHNTMRATLPTMIEQNRGSIVNIASIVSSLKGVPERYVYAGSKGAVIGLTKAVAADFAQFGIRANSICPGTIETPSLADRVAKSASRTETSNAQPSPPEPFSSSQARCLRK